MPRVNANDADKRLRIGYLIQSPGLDLSRPSGPQIHVTRIVDGLRARGHAVRTVQAVTGGVQWSDDCRSWTFVPYPSRWRPTLRLLERPIRLAQTLIPRLPYFNYFDSLRFTDLARTLLSDVDLLFERYEFMSSGGTLLSHQLGVPLLLEVNGSHFDELEHTAVAPHGIQRSVSRWLTRRTFAKATKVLPSGYGWQQRLMEIGLLDFRNCEVVWPGTDFELFSQQRDNVALREKYAVTQKVVITFVGGFDVWQGLPGLIEAFSRLQAENPAVTLLLIGDGPLKSELQKQIEDKQLAAHIHFLGRLKQDRTAEVLAITDIAVQLYSQRAEFVGMKLFDYMASGTAVIVTAPHKKHDLIQDGSTGLVIEPDNVEQLTAALFCLADNPILCTDMGNAARHVIAQNHTWDHRVTKIEQLAVALLGEQKNVS